MRPLANSGSLPNFAMRAQPGGGNVSHWVLAQSGRDVSTKSFFFIGPFTVQPIQ
jgi:hypothetical protein